jgi:beta-lactam-binding protein with PASTA domain/tRNA A-37 threonylcarbamoyl transferase component Bud32
MPTITDSIGRVLAGRYRIESALGSGASAHVFGAWDVTLRRRVAIKVLHPALAGDAAFLRRFQAEAQAAASLAHPHILAVHDWGQDDNGSFLVMELCGGGSLRDLLDEGRRLTVAQALVVGGEAAEGLAYAHGRGFVHRDVKPANLLFGEDGRLRLADFGLARALAEAAWTEPVGATLGTARYAAPEQAQGRPVDGRADVYSLALVLYEAVTGVVPFTADTTLATLMARVDARLPGHDALGLLAPVLDAAAAADPEQRLDASSLAARLRVLSAEMPGPERLALAGPGGRGLSPDLPASPSARHDDLTELGLDGAGFAAGSAGPLHTTDPVHATGAAPAATAGPASTSGAAAEGATAAGARHSRARWWGRRTGRKVALVVLAALLLAGAGVYGVFASQLLVPSHRLPALQGQTTAAASRTLRHDHFTLRVAGHRWSVTVPAGHVISETPSAGTVLEQGATVAVVLSSGPPPVAVPSLSSVTGGCAGVGAALSAAHLQSACTSQHSTTVKAGSVISWTPQGRAPLGSTVQVVVSSGPPMENIPSLSGSTCQGATTTLNAVGLQIQCQDVYNASVPSGQVVSWSPTGQAPEGTTVVVQISQGPPPVVVPQIYGKTVSQAVTLLEAAGLVPGTDQGPVGGKVFLSDPAEGATVPQGTTVNLYSQ